MSKTRKIILAGLAVLALLAVLRLATERLPSEQVLSVIPWERVGEHLRGTNGFAWNSGYDISLEQESLVVRVAVNPVPARGVTRTELAGARQTWQEGIERIWSRRFALRTAGGKIYPIIIKARFRGPEFHHDVIVRPGRGRPDQLNWNITASPEIVAHEFGHMIGLYDEYEAGAVNPQNPVLDGTSIMGFNPDSAAVSKFWHYEEFRRWFMQKTMMNDVTIIDYQEVVS